MPVPLANLGGWFGGTVNTVVTPFYNLFALNATYCFTTGTNVRRHESITQNLDDERKRVEGRIRNDRPNGLEVTTATSNWLRRAGRAISEEETNRRRYEQRRRIVGCYFLNCLGNYKISKQAVKKLEDVNECIRGKPPIDTVTEARPAPSVIDLPIQSAQLMPSREAIVAEVLHFIKDDDTVRMIGMCGPDKDEKTQLLKQINNSFTGRFFDFVIFVTASSECPAQDIQAQIIRRLGIKPPDDVATQATRISELLQKNNFLVLVDDLCGELDLQAIGIPYPLGVVKVPGVGEQLKRKVVITSPSGSQSIHSLMGVDKDIEVPRLEEDGARQLFNQYFGAQEDLYSDPHIGALAKDLVRELKGLPSELIHFGKVMKGQRDARQWEVIIEAVRKSNLRKDDTSCVVEKIVRNLEDRKEDLIAKRKDVNQTIENAEREGKIPTNEVKRWLEKGDAIICDVDAISANYQLKKDVTMEAAEKLLDVKECLGSSPSTISVESGPRPVIEMPGPCMSAEDHNLQEALNFIKDDPTGMIAIWGPGGVGKTHLLNNINNSLDGDLTFDYVVYVTASRGCSVKKIQADIVRKLKLREDNNPESQRCIIFDFLKKKSFLVLLDDLWDRIELEAVGLPYPLGTVNQLKRKVVLTTRSGNVCGQMEVRKDLKVAYLQEDEAWQLFQEKVGPETLSSSPRIEVLAKELVKELNGLPLALITIGRTMYAKTHTAQWEYAIQCMRQSCYDKDDPLGMEKAVFSQLKFSYDSLPNETLRHCFCICALQPEDVTINEEDLAQFLIGLGLVEVDEDIQSSYKKAYSLAGHLADACLIDSREKLYGSFTMHDVVRDMAHWIFSENNDRWFVRAGVRTEKNFSVPWIKAEYISLMWNGMKKLPPVCSSQCPKLRVLCLGHNALDGSIIAEEIKKFTSLTYLDLCYNGLREIPEELCSLANLEHLDLSGNDCIREVPHCFRNLIKLKFLYLTETGIRRIPEGVISSLRALLVIDLRVRYSADFISSRLCEELLMLPQLKAVDINVRNFAQYESLIREDANLPIRYLNLEIGTCACDDIFDILSHDLARETLYGLEIQFCYMKEIIVNHEYCFDTLNKLSLIYLHDLREIMFMGTSPASLFPLLTCLEVAGCDELDDLSWAMYLPCLEKLEVSQCEKMRQAFTSHHPDNKCSGQESSKTFPCLKYLVLYDCKLLVTIGDPDVAFPSLEKLLIVGCLELKTLPFQMDSLRKKLRVLEMDDASWDRLELEEGMKSFLQTKLVIDLSYPLEGSPIPSNEDRSEDDIGERSPIPADEDRSEEAIAASVLYAIAHDIGLAS